MVDDLSAGTIEAGQPELFCDLSDIIPDLTFSAVADARQWLEAERDSWGWTEIDPGVVNEIRQRTYVRIRDASSSLFQARGRSPSSEQIRSVAVSLFVNDRIPLAGSPAGKFFREWAASDKVAASDAVRCWFGIATVVESRNHATYPVPLDRFRNWVRASIAVDGLPDLGVPAQLTIADLRRQFSTEMTTQRIALQGHVSEADQIRTGLASERAAAVRVAEETKRLLADTIAEFKARMAESEDFYRNQLAVRTAVEYWKTRSKHHRNIAIVWGVVSAVLLLTTFACLLWNLDSIGHVSAETLGVLTQTGRSATDTTILIAKEWLGSITRVGLLVACVVWPLRIFVRNYMSHAHLSTDASERAVIVQTYLALLNDNELRDDPELKRAMLGPVIESMFRHTSDGIVKDDGLPWQPSAVADLLKSAAGGRS